MPKHYCFHIHPDDPSKVKLLDFDLDVKAIRRRVIEDLKRKEPNSIARKTFLRGVRWHEAEALVEMGFDADTFQEMERNVLRERCVTDQTAAWGDDVGEQIEAWLKRQIARGCAICGDTKAHAYSFDGECPLPITTRGLENPPEGVDVFCEKCKPVPKAG